MKIKLTHKALFANLEKWGNEKESYSINDFLRIKGIPIEEFKLIARSSKKFMKIWEAVESKAWENVLDALFTKSLPREKIAEYIKETEAFIGEDPEEVMQSLEDGQFKLELYLTAIGDTDSLKKYGRIGLKMDDSEALFRCCLERGMITQKEYDEIMAISDEDDQDG